MTTVKLDDKEHFTKEQIGVKEPFPVTNFASLFHKDKEHLALRNNFRATRKFLIAKFDCICELLSGCFFKFSSALHFEEFAPIMRTDRVIFVISCFLVTDLRKAYQPFAKG